LSTHFVRPITSRAPATESATVITTAITAMAIIHRLVVILSFAIAGTSASAVR
jgi:hypothetical protein